MSSDLEPAFKKLKNPVPLVLLPWALLRPQAQQTAISSIQLEYRHANAKMQTA